MKVTQNQLLFNASNLHVGGGVQVAASVISEWARMSDLVPECTEIWASSEVDANLRASGCDVASLQGYRVVNTHGLSVMFSPEARRLRNFRRVFTLFGPLYKWGFDPFSIVGFAQAWLIQPENEVAQRIPFIWRAIIRLKFRIQELFFRRANILVVELEHVAAALVSRKVVSAERVRVVHNCIGSIYTQPDRWLPVSTVPTSVRIKIGFVGRNYPHKNTAIFPEIARELTRHYELNVDFYVTFTDAEWLACDESFRDSVKNVGALSVAECPSFYQAMNAVIFPSLLECFSATPLEALAMGRPLFASDRQFNRDICGEHAIYFDPLNARDAAKKIAEYFKETTDHARRLDLARQHALLFSSAQERARKYLSLLVSPMT